MRDLRAIIAKAALLWGDSEAAMERAHHARARAACENWGGVPDLDCITLLRRSA